MDSLKAIPVRLVYKATPPTFADGDPVDALADSNGRQVVSINPGTSSSSLGKAEDGAHASGDVGIMALAVRQSAPTDLSAGGTNGDYEPLQVDSNGALWVSLATVIAGEDLTNNLLKVEQRFAPVYISTATTTVVKSGAGFLHTVVVNGGTAGTIVIYDNTAASGTIIASFDSTNALNTYTFNCTFTTGLTIVTSAATKLTANYR